MSRWADGLAGPVRDDLLDGQSFEDLCWQAGDLHAASGPEHGRQPVTASADEGCCPGRGAHAPWCHLQDGHHGPGRPRNTDQEDTT